MEKNNHQVDQQQGGSGRAPEKAKENAHQNTSTANQGDISHIDRQEGDMENGELGGNFGNSNVGQNEQEEAS